MIQKTLNVSLTTNCTIISVQWSSPLSAGNTTSMLISSCRQRYLTGGQLSPFIRQLEPFRSLRTEEHRHIPTGMSLASSWLHLLFSFFNLSWSEVKWSEFTQLCPILCNPMDCSLPGSSAHGILQARILEWIAISFSNMTSKLKGIYRPTSKPPHNTQKSAHSHCIAWWIPR